jgi:hypothetical protein
MTFKEMTNFVLNDVLASDSPVLLPRVKRALNIVHNEIQVNFDWRCMEESALLTYTANAEVLGVPSDYKRGVAFWTVSGANLTTIKEATETEINQLRGVVDREPGAPALSSTDYFQRWYEYQHDVRLLVIPGVNTSVKLDYLKFLPDYSLDADTDYFSQHHYYMLAVGAAARVLVAFMKGPTFQDPEDEKDRETKLDEDGRRRALLEEYMSLLTAAQEAEVRNKMGGALRFKRPPVAGGKV